MKTAMVGIHKRNQLCRVWYEGADLLAIMQVGQRFNLTTQTDGTITCLFDPKGARKVCKKTLKGRVVPVLDINNKAFDEFAKHHGVEAMEITGIEGGFKLTPVVPEASRRARIKRFQAALTTVIIYRTPEMVEHVSQVMSGGVM